MCYHSRNAFLSFADDWNASESYSIQCYFGKQSSHTKLPVPHSDPAVWCLSLVIGVSLLQCLQIGRVFQIMEIIPLVIIMQPNFRKRGKKGEKNGKGLRHFSMKVCEKVQKKGVTTYNEVADELVAEFSSSDNHMSPNDAVSTADQHPPRCLWTGEFIWFLESLCFRSMCMTRRTYDDACMTRWMYSWPWT